MQENLPEPWDMVGLHGTWTVDFCYDPSVADTDPAPNVGVYPGAITSAIVTIGGIAVAAEAYTGGGFIAAFDGDQQRAIAPGLYEDATIYPYNNNNPGMDFNENGSGYGRRVGKFKVHEIKYQGDELSALALDFIFDRDGKLLPMGEGC